MQCAVRLIVCLDLAKLLRYLSHINNCYLVVLFVIGNVVLKEVYPMIITGNLWLNHTKSIDWFGRAVKNRDELNTKIIGELLDQKNCFYPDAQGKLPLWVMGSFGVGNNLDEVAKPLLDAFDIFLVPSATDDTSKLKKLGLKIMPSIHRIKEGQATTMCAYPMLEWPGKHTGSQLVYGYPTDVTVEGSDCVAVGKKFGWLG